MVRATKGFLNSGEKYFNQKDQNEKNSIPSSNLESKCLSTRRLMIKVSAKIKTNLSTLFVQKKQAKRAQILKTRQEKLLKFRINYIPLCSDEDWEAMAAFYSKNPK